MDLTRLNLFSFIVVVCVAIANGQPPLQACQQQWQRSANICSQNATLNLANLRYLATNGSDGSLPGEGIANFRAKACALWPQLDICGQAITQRVNNSTYCQNEIERNTIRSQFQILFGGLYQACSHSCRYSLAKEIRSCYNYVKLSPSDLSDIAMVRTTAIGENYGQVYQFCLNRDSVANCIRSKVLACQDSGRVLGELDIVLGSFERGVDILCRNIGVYLAGIHCFRNPIPEVRFCFQNLDTKMQKLNMISPQPTADQLSLIQFCNIRLEQIDCEMGAWARHQYATCARAVTGMRTELECALIPRKCLSAFPSLYSSLCSRMNYYYEERKPYNAAPKQSIPIYSLLAMLLVSLLASYS